MRVSRDGSTLLFNLPSHVSPEVIAPAGTGLNILSKVYPTLDRRLTLKMYHFDEHANLRSENPVVIPLEPYAMAVLPSRRTIVAGFHSKDPYSAEDRKYGFAILDESDRLTRSIDLPLPPGGGGWTFASPYITTTGGLAYVMLHSNEPPQTAIASIAQDGNQVLIINVIAAPSDSETRHHNMWVFGAGVAVDLYVDPTDRPHIRERIDEYDLRSGKKIATKSAYGGGIQFGCYMGDEFSMLAGSANVDPARHLSPDTLRLVTAKLQ